MKSPKSVLIKTGERGFETGYSNSLLLKIFLVVRNLNAVEPLLWDNPIKGTQSFIITHRVLCIDCLY